MVHSLVGVDAAQSVDTGVDVRQQRRHWFQLIALQTPDADAEDDVEEEVRGTGDRKYDQEPRQHGGNERYMDDDVDYTS